MSELSPPRSGLLHKIGNLFRALPDRDNPNPDPQRQYLWSRAIFYWMIHGACIAVIWVGWSWPAVAVAAFMYALRVFTLTAFYHRYFSHRTFKTGRITQFIFGFIGCTAVQRGPLWWAAHHRFHHTHSDDELDLHSPRQRGVFWSHMCWFLTPEASSTNVRLIPDFNRYPEIRFINKYDLVPPLLAVIAIYGFGAFLEYVWPESGVTALQMLVWGFFVSTVAVYHVTYLVNSATHLYGTRRYQTKDDSKNSMLIALLTFGEGWHNNHHYYQNSTRQGFFWWEIDISYYILRLMGMFGLVWELRPVPKRIMFPAPKEVPVAATPAIGDVK